MTKSKRAFAAMLIDAQGFGDIEEISQKSLVDIIYELKKIYSRLVSIESFLDSESDPVLLKLRNYVSQSIELFQMLINNISVFRETIDDLIVIYYKFLLEVYYCC